MSRHHAHLIRSIFHDPPSGNVHWREIESLLTHPIFDEKLLKSISARTLDPRARAEFEKAARMRSVGYGHSRAADAAPADGPDPMDRPGWIDGTFEIVRRLGRGGFGVVYECASTNFGVVAVKVFLGASSANTPHHARFTEAINMAQIAHASIPRLVAIGDHRGYPYIAIELIDGVNLRAWAAASTIGFDERRQILADVRLGAAFRAPGDAHEHQLAQTFGVEPRRLRDLRRVEDGGLHGVSLPADP